MLCCCKKKNNQDVLIPSAPPSPNDHKRNENIIISSSRTTSASNKEDYEPPQLPDHDLIQRLSLPTSPAQKEGKKMSVTKHRKKAGFVKKKGHLVKNWKKRYLVLKDGTLTYYGSSNTSKKDENGFDLGVSTKGWTTLEGSKVELFDENPCRLQVVTPVMDKSLLIETDSPEETEDWHGCITDAIRASNIASLSQGDRIPQVVQWYMEEYGGFEEARKVLEFGHLFKLHFIDPSGVIHLIKVWLQANSNGVGLVFYVSLDGQNPPPAAAVGTNTDTNAGSHATTSSSSTTATAVANHTNSTIPKRGMVSMPSSNIPLSSRFDGLEISFHEIVSITKGTSENVYKTKDMGPDSAFFTMKTADSTYVLEVETRAKRDRWAMAIRDTVNFVHIPIPGLRKSSSIRY